LARAIPFAAPAAEGIKRPCHTPMGRMERAIEGLRELELMKTGILVPASRCSTTLSPPRPDLTGAVPLPMSAYPLDQDASIGSLPLPLVSA